MTVLQNSPIFKILQSSLFSLLEFNTRYMTRQQPQLQFQEGMNRCKMQSLTLAAPTTPSHSRVQSQSFRSPVM